MRLVVVVEATTRAAANRAASRVDRTGGNRTFTAALADPANPATPVAYWCSWDITATRHTLAALVAEFGKEGVANLKPTDTPSRAQPANVLDAAKWTPDQVLSALGLVRLDTTDLAV